tara:strand:- start:2291 stop:3181 length:891 start_codon:yes stop_codon:yes gene_type:complete
MRQTLFLVLMFATASALAAPQEPIELWPDGKVPGEENVDLPEETAADKNGDGIIRISNVSVPTLQFYPAPADSNTGTAVVVVPGGGYGILASKHEGTDVCEFLNSIGVNAVLLKYRVPRRENLDKHHAPLQDAQRAISLVRSKAEEWKIDPQRVGMLGFSAGGHLTVMAMTSQEKRTFTPDATLDAHSCVPDFAVPIYPAYLKNEAESNALSPEIVITEETPPAFIAIAHGDKRFVEGAALLYLEMFRKGRQCELHIYGHGGHGFGIKKISEKVGEWPLRMADWFGAMGYLKAAAE